MHGIRCIKNECDKNWSKIFQNFPKVRKCAHIVSELTHAICSEWGSTKSIYISNWFVYFVIWLLNFVRFTLHRWSASFQFDCWCLSMSFSIVWLFFFFCFFVRGMGLYFKPQIVSAVHIINNCFEWLSFKPALVLLYRIRIRSLAFIINVFFWMAKRLSNFQIMNRIGVEMQKHALLTFPMRK